MRSLGPPHNRVLYQKTLNQVDLVLYHINAICSARSLGPPRNCVLYQKTLNQVDLVLLVSAHKWNTVQRHRTTNIA